MILDSWRAQSEVCAHTVGGPRDRDLVLHVGNAWAVERPAETIRGVRRRASLDLSFGVASGDWRAYTIGNGCWGPCLEICANLALGKCRALAIAGRSGSHHLVLTAGAAGYAGAHTIRRGRWHGAGKLLTRCTDSEEHANSVCGRRGWSKLVLVGAAIGEILASTGGSVEELVL